MPETIGSIAYLNKNFKILKKYTIGGYVLSCIGDERNFSLISTKYGNSNSDLAAKEGKSVDIAVINGADAVVLLAAAMSFTENLDELTVAAALHKKLHACFYQISFT